MSRLVWSKPTSLSTTEFGSGERPRSRSPRCQLCRLQPQRRAEGRTFSSAQIRCSPCRPGNYDTLRVNGFLMLNPGLYSVLKLEVGDFGRIIAIMGNVRMTVVNTLIAGRHTEIHPALGLAAEHLVISVAGSDVNGQPAASIGEHSRVLARCLPHHMETPAFAHHARATGAFAAFDIAIGAQARVAFQNGFPADTPGYDGSQQLSGYFAVSP